MDVESRVKLCLYQLNNNFESEKYFLARKKDEKLNKLLREFGWTRTILFKYLVTNLCPEDWVSGPQAEHGNTDGQVWVFGKTIQSKEIYIKISHFSNGTRCISFHEAEWELVYPLKGGN